MDKLSKALDSPDCSIRWESVKEAISSWENAFYLYPEIEKRTRQESYGGSSHGKLVLLKEFIREQIDAMKYRAKLEDELSKSKSANNKHKLELRKALEVTIGNNSEVFMKRMFALNAALDLAVEPNIQHYILETNREVSMLASILVTMRNGYTELKGSMRDHVNQNLLRGIKSDSFQERYFSLRSLEKLRLKEDSAQCLDPTDIPGTNKK